MMKIVNRFGVQFMIRDGIYDGCGDLNLGIFLGENLIKTESEILTDTTLVRVFLGKDDKYIAISHRFGSKNWQLNTDDGEETVGYSELILRIIDSIKAK